MSGDEDLEIVPGLAVPTGELTYRASRSGGPGGQHANTSSTRVELVWNVAGSPSLTPDQRERLTSRLANRITSAGDIILAEAGSRSQHRNKQVVTRRLVDLLREAMEVRPPRKKTRPPRSAVERRLKGKKRRSEVKRLRGRIGLD